MTLLAIPFGMSTGKRGALYGRHRHRHGAVLLDRYQRVYVAIGQGGLLTPWLAGWAPNIIVLGISSFLFLTVKNVILPRVADGDRRDTQDLQVGELANQISRAALLRDQSSPWLRSAGPHTFMANPVSGSAIPERHQQPAGRWDLAACPKREPLLQRTPITPVIWCGIMSRVAADFSESVKLQARRLAFFRCCYCLDRPG